MKPKQNFIDKYYLHSIAFALIAVLFYVFSVNNSFLYTSILNYSNLKADPFDGTVTPIKYTLNYLTVKQVDRNKNFTDLDSSMFIKMPDYNPEILARDLSGSKSGDANYEETMLQRVVYITPYMGNYNHDGKENVGSHLAVDIKAPTGTPVYAIANGVITKVGYEKGGFGNYITIRHENVKLSDGTIGTIYSNYAHLNTVTIKEGVKISRGDPIGTVGETGLAVGSHLHFQIDVDTAPFHPYWPFSGTEQRAAGLDFFSAITNGLGKENAMKYTINPMTFVYSNINNTQVSATNDIPLVNNVNTGALVQTEKQVAILNNDISVLNTQSTNNTNTATIDTPINTILTGATNTDLKIEDTATISKLDLNSNIALVNASNLTYVDDSGISLVGGVNTSTNIFSDVDDNNKSYEAIKYYKDKGLIAGYSDNNFYPNNEISRIESLKILLNSYSYLPINDKDSVFADVDKFSWGNSYIQRAISISLLDTRNNSFYPDRTINRVEVLKLITKLSNIDLSTYAAKNYEIKDVLKTQWEYPYVVFAIDNNLFSLDNGNFYTSKTVSRGELVDLMYKFKK
ncbi:MAG: peptidoglycan DD-metalloendopeptidase family protein [Candidatus Gracilibacteria bacterium]|nr:peptidoglycan DD-metalloendopeptidase family protein [Candidatus Gracilibacteria bacterium]